MTLWATDPDVPGLLVWLAGLLGLAGVVGRRDPWLGACVAWTVLGCGWAPILADPLRVATLTAFGALGILGVRAAPPRVRRALVVGLVVVAVAEVAYQCGQLAGWDPLWPGRPLHPTTPSAARYPGTLGSPTWLGALLALAGAVGPLGALPAFGLGLWLAQAKLAGLALAAGLVVTRGGPKAGCRMAAASVAALGGAWLLLAQSWDSGAARWAVWRLAFGRWWAESPWIGFGPGSWWTLVPGWQERAQVYPTEHFRKAHLEPLQVAMEHGLIGLALVIGWGWAHRAMWRGPYAGACAALLVLSLGGFPFRVAETALPALLVLGLATGDAAPPAGGSWRYWT